MNNISVAVTGAVFDEEGRAVPVICRFDRTPGSIDYKQYEFSYGGPHEEGFSYTSVVVSVDWEQERIIKEVSTQASDCDGPLDTWIVFYAKFEDIRKQGVFVSWHRDSGGQRDYFAEAAGY